MTKNEIELINLIRESGNPEEAMLIATKIILDFLKQRESSEAQAPACLPESA